MAFTPLRSDIVFDDTLGQQYYPVAGDVVRVTATGKITWGQAVASWAWFYLQLPIGTNLCDRQITIPGVNQATAFRFMCQFLITFQTVAQDNSSATVESNGMIALAVDQPVTFFANWSPGPNTTTITMTNTVGTVDVKVTPAVNGPGVSFDECVIEYLMQLPAH
jgi:hypothetical protein